MKANIKIFLGGKVDDSDKLKLFSVDTRLSFPKWEHLYILNKLHIYGQRTKPSDATPHIADKENKALQNGHHF